MNPYGVIVLAAALIYVRTIGFHFTYYDDVALISDNQRALHNFWNIFSSFTSPLPWRFESFYRPVMFISLLIDAQWNSASLIPFHITNILIHCTAACLVFSLLSRLKYEKTFSLLCALLFAVHPLFVMAVAWIPGRNDSLMAVFSLSSFIFVIDYLRSTDRKSYVLHLLFFLLALLTKETAVVLAVLFALYIYLIEKQSIFRNKMLFAGWIALYLLWGGLRYSAVKPQGIDPALLSSNIQQGIIALLQYIGKMVFPLNLSPLPTIQDTGIVFGALASLFIGLVLVIARYKRGNYLLFGICWIVLSYLPPLLFVNNALYFEHRSYLPLVGLFFILWEIANAFRGWGISKKGMVVAGAATLCIFSYLNILYGSCFANRAAFWQGAVNRSPGSDIAHTNKGLIYLEQKEYGRAFDQFTISLGLNKNNPDTYNNLGCLYAGIGDIDNAVANFSRALAIDNQYFGAYCNLANYYCKIKQHDKAIGLLLESVRINPHSSLAFYNLGNIYLERQQYDAAIEYYRQSLAIAGDDLDCSFNLGIAYYRSARYDKALEQFTAIHKINPHFSTALGSLLADCAGKMREKQDNL